MIHHRLALIFMARSAFALQAEEQCRFWSEPATPEQKRIIVHTMHDLGLLRQVGSYTIAEINDPALWPTPFRVWPDKFTRWDAYRLIRRLEARLKGDK
jgi:hypothetical protein